MIEEGKARVEVEGVFYNPHMKQSRDLSVEVVKRIPEELYVLDGFAASGVRGIRYFLEAENVKKVAFVDINPRAIEILKKNIEINGVEGEIIKRPFEDLGTNLPYNFIEIDPFGSPAQFIYPAILMAKHQKRFYLSVTATDTAVLCGRHKEACLRNYHAWPLHDWTCHETGLRILMGFVIRAGYVYDYWAEVLFSFYYRHQMKTIIKFEKGAQKIHDQLSHIGHIYRLPNLQKGVGIKERWAGPLWLGPLFHKDYINPELKLMREVSEELPIPYHYHLHEIAKHYKIQEVPPIKKVIKRLGGTRTHFSPLGFKTDKKIEEIVQAIKEA
ncbi:MAG: hypothetical protein GXN92_03055 [Candidatus Micrarchaeota archaeon]|nr:hypothetical protein [Candidatus Micrarchaeota archaeon]